MPKLTGCASTSPTAPPVRRPWTPLPEHDALVELVQSGLRASSCPDQASERLLAALYGLREQVLGSSAPSPSTVAPDGRLHGESTLLEPPQEPGEIGRLGVYRIHAVLGGTVLAASAVQFQDASTLYATFNLSGQTPGGLTWTNIGSVSLSSALLPAAGRSAPFPARRAGYEPGSAALPRLGRQHGLGWPHVQCRHDRQRHGVQHERWRVGRHPHAGHAGARLAGKQYDTGSRAARRHELRRDRGGGIRRGLQRR